MSEINDAQATEIGKIIQQTGACSVQVALNSPKSIGVDTVTMWVQTNPEVRPCVYDIHTNGEALRVYND